MSEYPEFTNWRSRVLLAATGREGLELQRITAMVNYLAETMVKRNDEVYNEAVPWLENAEKEHAKRPFHAILAPNKPEQMQFILTENDIFERQR